MEITIYTKIFQQYDWVMPIFVYIFETMIFNEFAWNQDIYKNYNILTK